MVFIRAVLLCQLRFRQRAFTGIFLLLLVPVFLSGCGNGYYRGPVSEHFDGRRFDNPWAPMPNRFGEFLKWRLTADRGYWPESVPVEPTLPPERVTGDELRVTYVGHATVLLQTAGLNILTDPIWSERASPVGFTGPKRVAAPGVRFEDLPPIDLVLVSHNHYDHLDLPTLKRLHQAFDPLVLTPLGNDAVIRSAVPDMRLTTLDWGEGFSYSEQVRLTLEPMQHWSARGLFDRREALWGAFVIEAPGGPIYFLADAGYARHLSEDFVARHGTPRLSLLPVGAYEPRWFMQQAHMNLAEAVQTFLDLGQGHAMGTQHEVFAMADEAYADPRRDLQEALRTRGVDESLFILPRVGGWFTVPPRGAVTGP
ncbi:MAG: MBL fold metallo-hydrolase [Desulfomicrobium sp.]|nr:MBL fold metallo-hydrolase [Pseudomonadota bacterium]MBV1713279.1 MBL fold metallo-hydrolase [Desulfomicrobium sp.]MBU4571382.1 MBL fold metallo-hydrolase [Pseudomonadota bacterium]MBU4595645.1 MBL fold metallo-hydrolase [Pseudomonadota bacterium]MBV1720086.1 MBL fold metallo-hydrolase [Desulfomicrobium sp.]